jgi:hypothetical protein
MHPRHERQAHNETLFRAVNEQIATLDRKLAESSEDSDELYEFECECGREGRCDGHVRMTLAEYEAARSQDDRFIVVPGHETDELEHVVERSERYLIVDKVPDAEKFVEDDPRGAPSG